MMSDTIRTVRSRIANLFERIGPRSRRIPVDIEDHVDEFVVRADLPGLDRRDLDVTAYRDGIHIAAANQSGEEEDLEYSRRERNHGRQERIVELPAEIDEGDVSATYVNGVLVIRASKRRQEREREVSRADSQAERRAEEPEGFETGREDESTEPDMGPSEEELREYEARTDRQLERQRDFQRDKSGQPYRRT